MDHLTYCVKVFYIQYETSFLVSEVSLDNAVSDEEAIKECKILTDNYYKMLFKNQYESMPDTNIKVILVKKCCSCDLPVTIGYTEIKKRYNMFPEKLSSEYEYDRLQEYYRDYR